MKYFVCIFLSYLTFIIVERAIEKYYLIMQLIFYNILWNNLFFTAIQNKIVRNNIIALKHCTLLWSDDFIVCLFYVSFKTVS